MWVNRGFAYVCLRSSWNTQKEMSVWGSWVRGVTSGTESITWAAGCTGEELAVAPFLIRGPRRRGSAKGGGLPFPSDFPSLDMGPAFTDWGLVRILVAWLFGGEQWPKAPSCLFLFKLLSAIIFRVTLLTRSSWTRSTSVFKVSAAVLWKANPQCLR